MFFKLLDVNGGKRCCPECIGNKWDKIISNMCSI